MKTLRMIGMALFAVLMCVNFVSCSSSDDDPTEEKEEVVTQGKKLVEMVWENGGYQSDVVYKFSYHNDGKLSQITHEFNNGISDIKENYYYNWIDNQIKISAEGFNYVCSLSNGLITEIMESDNKGNADSGGSTHSFTYNNSKELTNYKSEAHDDSEIRYEYSGIWNNGNMTEFKYIAGHGESQTITYSNIKNKGWWYPSCDYIGMDYYMENAAFLFLANPSLLGKPCANLPKRIEGEYNYDFIFDIGQDGYVEKCKIVSGSSTTVYTYKWQ